MRYRGDLPSDYDINVETTQGKTPNTATVKIALKDVPPAYVMSAEAIDFRHRQPPPPGFLPDVVEKLRKLEPTEWFTSSQPVLPSDSDTSSNTVIVYENTVLVDCQASLTRALYLSGTKSQKISLFN